MNAETLVTIILFGPLIGAAVAGLVGRRIGDTASMAVTTGFLMLSAFLSWVVFSTGLYLAGRRGWIWLRRRWKGHRHHRHAPPPPAPP